MLFVVLPLPSCVKYSMKMSTNKKQRLKAGERLNTSIYGNEAPVHMQSLVTIVDHQETENSLASGPARHLHEKVHSTLFNLAFVSRYQY